MTMSLATASRKHRDLVEAFEAVMSVANRKLPFHCNHTTPSYCAKKHDLVVLTPEVLELRRRKRRAGRVLYRLLKESGARI